MTRRGERRTRRAVAEEKEEERDEEASVSSEDSEEQDDYQPAPRTVVNIRIRNKKTEEDGIYIVLLDTGTSKIMGTEEAIQRAGLTMKDDVRERKYDTAAGTFTTTKKARLRSHHILELSSRRVLQPVTVRVVEGKLGQYDFIFGRSYLTKYGINLCFEDSTIRWDGMISPMRTGLTFAAEQEPLMWNEDETRTEDDRRYPLHVHNTAEQFAIKYLTDVCQQQQDEEAFVQRILDSDYHEQDLDTLSQEQVHLTVDQRKQLAELLKKHSDLFRGNLGTWPDEKIDFELRPDSKPFHCQRPIRIPRIHIETLTKEVNRLCEIGVLEKVYEGEAGPWCAASWIIPKKGGQVRFITDFREVNKCIRRKPWPMPHIMDLIQDIGSYDYVTAIDLSMAFYHFELSPKASEMTTFMLPFGLFKYRRLAMGLSISPDVLQGHMARLFADQSHIKVYMDDLLVFTKGGYSNHLEAVDKALSRLETKNLAVNAQKTFWCVDKVDYLGFRLTKQGVLPQPKKVDAITGMRAPTNKTQVRRFIGMVNYYRYMWKRRSELLTPLTEVSGKNSKFEWKERQQQAFEKVKAAISKEVMLSFPDYSQPFQLYVDASEYQLGAVLKQENKTLAFFSRKLNKSQRNYTVGEKEMLSVVEALKEFRSMILGYEIHVYTDHRNWTHDKTYRNQRVLRWRMTIEDYVPIFHYVKGPDNVVADALSRLPIDPVAPEESFNVIAECFDASPTTWRRFQQPITIAEIGRKQKKDKHVQQLQRQSPDRLGEWFEDIGKKSGPDRVITAAGEDNKARILVPQSMRKRLINWYHETLIHPGVNRLYNTLRQHYTWPKMLEDIRASVKKCGPCQRAKRGGKGYGHIPVKDVETAPWKDVAVDLSGPWKADIDGKETVFWTFTIIDPFTGWVEILPITTKKSESITDLFVQQWLRRYPRPSRVIFDAGSEFDCEAFQTCLLNWYIKPEPITVKNPRANAIVERMHQVLGDMLRVQLLSEHKHDDPVADMCSAAAYAIRATVHGVTRYSPSQLVYAKDMILRTKVEADVEHVRRRREQAILANNTRENKRRIAYKYQVGDRVLVLSGKMSLDPKMKLHEGPFKVLSYDKASGTLHIQRRNYVEPINIRNVRPFFG